MTDIKFDRLRDVALRDAWKHEALSFTPWLAQNIAHIADAIGMSLELVDTEVAVGGFSADILARNTQDDSIVLIENQLEQTDHTHLGQIMTYLAGLNAKTVVWIAPTFREPHQSAIRWLNQYTEEGFSFFALRLRVVRIGDSPYAPIFEIVEGPSAWERQLQVEVRGTKSEVTVLRTAFWEGLLKRHPDLSEYGLKVGGEGNKWVATKLPDVVVGLYLASQTCGIYIRGKAGVPSDEVRGSLAQGLGELSRQLGVQVGEETDSWLLTDKVEHPLKDQAHWPVVWDWMARRLKDYMDGLNLVVGGPS